MAAETSRSGYSVDSYIGYLISLTSNCEIRYEGIIDYINLEECSICLRNVRCFGTEGRQKAGLKIPPSEKVYEYIIFRATDVKDLLLISPPPVQTVPIHNDSAILQSRYSPMGPASTPGSGSISDQRSQASQLGSARSTLQGGLPLYQATKNIESLGSIPAVAVCSGFGIPMYWQGFTPTSGNSHLPQAPLLSAPPGFSIPHSLQQHAQFSTVNPLFSSGTLGFHEATTSPPSIVSCASTLMSTSVQHPNVNSSTSVQHPNVNSFFATTPNLSQYFSSLAPPASCTPSLNSISLPATVAHTHASLLAAEPSLNLPNRSLLNSNLASVFGLNIPSVLPLGYINTPGTSLHENIASIRSSPSLPSLPFQTFSQSMPSSISSFSSIQGDTTLPLVTLGQLQHPSYSMLPSPLPLLTIHEDAKFKAPEIKIKSESEPLTDELPPLATSTKEPLMPLPRHRSYSRLPSSLPVQTIHEDEKFTAQEPKIKSESEPLTYELTSPATSMIEPLLPKHPSYSPVSSSLPVQTIHKDAKFKAQEPKMKSESEPFKYEVPPSAGPKPLLPLPIHPCYSSLSSFLPVQTIHEDAELRAQGLKIKSGSGPLKYEMPPSARSMKEPLLPLPELTHRRYSRPVIRYSEDFDFIAMNEKFNKAEVWGQLGKGKGLVEYDERGQSSNENAVQEEDEESPNLETQPAYSKDDFFDKISYRTSDPGTHSGSARVLEQLKVDMDTSGDFPRRRSNRGGGWGFRDRNDGR